MTDYRPPGERQTYFDALYRMNLKHGVMPGCVYLYMPALKHHFGWDEETALWFAFLNGCTQNPLTSLRLLERLPAPPTAPAEMTAFKEWFDAEWPRLQFDTDRRYAKKDTPAAIWSYAKQLAHHPGSYAAMYAEMDWQNLWNFTTNQITSFGRLSAFSYLEYVRIMGHGADCADLLFEDRSGSRSHRNGMLFLCNMDHLVWDKRASGGFDGSYQDFGKMCAWLTKQADLKLLEFGVGEGLKDATRFTFESQLCTFKNSFFGRRYPGVYADMGYERMTWYRDNVGIDKNLVLIERVRDGLPDWLRLEVKHDGLTIAQRGAMFPSTGVPYRAEHFL